jgi:hypothetical protein
MQEVRSCSELKSGLHISVGNYCSGKYRRAVLACFCIDAGLRRIDSAEKYGRNNRGRHSTRPYYGLVEWRVLLPVLLSNHQLIHYEWVAILKYSRRDRFGTDRSVKRKPTDPGERPPADGMTLERGGIKNRAHFQPKGTVILTGALCLTNGKKSWS